MGGIIHAPSARINGQHVRWLFPDKVAPIVAESQHFKWYVPEYVNHTATTTVGCLNGKRTTRSRMMKKDRRSYCLTSFEPFRIMGASIYEEYFDIDVARSTATCKKCGTVVARKQSNSSGTSKHLEKRHPELFEQLKAKKSDPTPSITSAFGTWQPGGAKHESFNRALSLMIAVDPQPTALVDRQGFRHFMSVVAPAYTIRKLRKSGVDRDRFEELQSLEDVSPRWLVKDIEVRWSSLYHMLERFIGNRSVITSFLSETKEYPQLSSGDFSLMELLHNAPEPIKEATEMLQGREATISVVIPTIFVLRRALGESASNFAKDILACLEARVDHAGIEKDPNYLIATLLDVRYKCDYLEDEYCGSAVETLTNEAYKFLSPDQAIKSKNRGPSPVSPDKENSRPLQPAQHSADATDYWHQEINARKYPVLAQMADKFLCAPATSVESERLFSTASRHGRFA
uniref:Dimer_Tnp_hAT domain-containing protein n=1 Tax=Steinernema glaseri TaxID=37863 RepID=A0A1I8AK01_9BILA